MSSYDSDLSSCRISLQNIHAQSRRSHSCCFLGVVCCAAVYFSGWCFSFLFNTHLLAHIVYIHRCAKFYQLTEHVHPSRPIVLRFSLFFFFRLVIGQICWQRQGIICGFGKSNQARVMFRCASCWIMWVAWLQNLRCNGADRCFLGVFGACVWVWKQTAPQKKKVGPGSREMKFYETINASVQG